MQQDNGNKLVFDLPEEENYWTKPQKPLEKEPPTDMIPMKDYCKVISNNVFGRRIEVNPYATLAEIASHPMTGDCDDMECMFCSIRDCPHGEPLHYHHDGCPSCNNILVPQVYQNYS